MKTYRNVNFKKRSYECSHIVFCTAKSVADIMRIGNWVECDDSENNLDQLFIENAVRYYGFL